MKRTYPGVTSEPLRNRDEFIEGIFLVRVDRVYFRWHPQRPFYLIRFAILEPESKARRILQRAYLLHPTRDVEVRLVSSRLPLRHRSARKGRDR